MKKIIVGIALMVMATASYATAFTCKGYTDSQQVGEAIVVNASKAIVAETKAYQRMKKAGLKIDIVRCQ
ncbi:MAG: hypothetical protein KAG06_08510 [Methylococcales bacterium]|nr:hypothetical protein [Methylococcales bacterium]